MESSGGPSCTTVRRGQLLEGYYQSSPRHSKEEMCDYIDDLSDKKVRVDEAYDV